MNFKDDFPMLNKGYIYFDNSATTFKPYQVIDSISEYYESYSVNTHRGDYNLSHIADNKYEGVRDKVKTFINASYSDEIVFTSGTTEGINMVVNGFFSDFLKDGDEVLLTKSEHASLLLPWFILQKKKKILIKYIELDGDYKVTIQNVKKSITSKTKVIALAHITNVIGDIRPVKEICKLAKEKNILTVIDGAQSVPHIKVDVKEIDADFYVFSGHKMCGPTGVGVLYGKYELLNKVSPLIVGGGMNSYFTSDGHIDYKPLPSKLEAGTKDIAAIIGLGSAVDYLSNKGMNQIHEYVTNLKEYLLSRLKEITDVTIYNPNSEGSIVIFNMNDPIKKEDKAHSQDVSIHLSKYGICIRSGDHCDKILYEVLNVTNTCRISLYFYNTKEEIDFFINVLKETKNIYDNIV